MTEKQHINFVIVYRGKIIYEGVGDTSEERERNARENVLFEHEEVVALNDQELTKFKAGEPDW